MSFGEILSTLLIGPLQLLFETIFTIVDRLVQNPGLSIVALSLAMNFLVLPLYKRADAMQEEERQTELKLHKGVAHIKKVFRGDERMMMLQTYYRQNHYKPSYVLKGATSLLLEIPFFIAAYRFLSGLKLLNGVPFGPIGDLGRPDGMLVLGSLTLNLLPILMTAINLVSCVIYTKGSLPKTKIQLYAMAIFFLFFLYGSPAGLVFYWTLNNLFSLGKTLCYKSEKARKGMKILSSLAGLFVAVFGLFFYGGRTLRRCILILALALVLQLPLAWPRLKGKLLRSRPEKVRQPNGKLFLAGALFLTALTGLLIPTTVIHASPQEFMAPGLSFHPMWYVVSALCLAFGTFVIWLGIFYWLAKPASRAKMESVTWILCGVGLVDYMFFGRKLGNLSAELVFDTGLYFTGREYVLNLAVVVLLALALWFLAKRFRQKLAWILIVATLAAVGMSGYQMVGISGSVNTALNQSRPQEDLPEITLSKTEKNVVVFMLDRGVNAFIPYIMNERPELREQFAGFTHYTNVTSLGFMTNFSTPSLFGGYDYTPAKLNKRSNESLGQKHDEALRVMPAVFGENGYEVTAIDPPYAGYQTIPDLSIYDGMANVKSYIAKGAFTGEEAQQKTIDANKRNFFCYSVMKIMPAYLQETFYNKGTYNQGDGAQGGAQAATGPYTAYGQSTAFLNAYDVLTNLSNMTKVTQDGKGQVLIMDNDSTHDVDMLQEPGYVPAQNVDNREYEMENAGRFTLNGRTLKMETAVQYAHYQCDMAAFLQLGAWFDTLRELGAYDNTRIILVSDHGRSLGQVPELILDNGMDAEGFYAVLMVKDFGATEFTTSDTFMTVADVPALATQDLIENPTNPFTGNPISSEDKTAHDQYLIWSKDWDISVNCGNTYLPATWYTVHDDIWNRDNWELVAQDAVLDTEK